MLHRFKHLALSRGGSSGWLIVGGVVALAFWLSFPHVITIEDETYYLGQAHALARGALHPTSLDPYPGLDYPLGPLVRYPLIWPLLLAPFVYVKWVLGLWVNAGIHIASALLFIRLLRQRGLPDKYGFLFLLQPALLLYSSTAMADSLAVFLLLLGLWWRGRDRVAAAGFCWGLMAALRMACGIYGVVFFLIDLREWRQGRLSSRSLVEWVICYAAAASLAPLSYQLLQGYPLPFYYLGASRGAGWESRPLIVAQFLLFYVGALMAIYPGMLLGWAWNSLRERAAVGAVILFQSWYFFADSGRSLLESWVIGQRMVLPAVALLLLGYAGLWHAVEKRRSWLWPLFCVGTLTVAGLLAYRLGMYHRKISAAACLIDQGIPEGTALHYSPEAMKLVAMLQKPKTYLPDRRLEIRLDPKGVYYLMPSQYLSYRWSVGRPMAPLPAGADVATEFASLYRVTP